MAFGTPVAGTIAYSAQNGTSVAPGYPSGIAAGDVLVLVVGQKPSTANGGTATTPSGWTLRDSSLAKGGYGTTLGADTGNTNLFVYSKDTVDGNETGNLNVTIGTNNVAWGVIVHIPANNGTITYAATDGEDTSGGASVSVTGATDPGMTAGDMVIASFCMPTDATTGNNTYAISQSGVTYGASGLLAFPDSGTGNDIGGVVFYDEVDTGTSTGVPTMSFTATGTTTNARGPGIMLRVREALPTITGDLDATEAGTDTASINGDVLVQGSLSAAETGDDTFSSSGTVTDPAITGTLAATETGDDTFSATGDVIVQGSLSVAETGNDTLAATGSVLVQGSLSATEAGDDTLSATGSVLVQGSLAATEEGADTLAATGAVLVQGSLSATETGDDTFAGSGGQVITGTLAATEAGDDTFAATGGVVVQGTLDATETGADAFAAEGGVRVQGDLSAAETGADTFSATGGVVISGDLAAAETGDDTFDGTGTLNAGVTGSLAATETGTDTLSAEGVVLVSGDLAATDSPDTFAGTGGVVIAGDLAAQEVGDDTFAAQQLVITTFGAMLAAETGADSLSSPNGYWEYYAEAGYTVGDEVGRVLVQGTGSMLEALEDTANAAGQIIVQGTVSAVETLTDTMKAGIVLGFAPAGRTQSRGDAEQSRPTELEQSRGYAVNPTRADISATRSSTYSARR